MCREGRGRRVEGEVINEDVEHWRQGRIEWMEKRTVLQVLHLCDGRKALGCMDLGSRRDVEVVDKYDLQCLFEAMEKETDIF